MRYKAIEREVQTLSINKKLDVTLVHLARAMGWDSDQLWKAVRNYADDNNLNDRTKMSFDDKLRLVVDMGYSLYKR